jgi:hypothetical protein
MEAVKNRRALLVSDVRKPLRIKMEEEKAKKGLSYSRQVNAALEFWFSNKGKGIYNL